MASIGATDPADISVSRERRELRIRWRDDHESVYGFDLLRKECPCALCNDLRGRAAAPVPSLTVLSGPVLRAGEVQASAVEAVGRYALKFVWSDGHDSGIYAYTHLRGLCPCPTCRSEREASAPHA